MRSTVEPVYVIVVLSAAHCKAFRQDSGGFSADLIVACYWQTVKAPTAILDKEQLIAYSSCL